jgi:predicted nuclease of predicted toxin-antitoxin system
VKILADMPISPRSAAFLRKLGHQVEHANELGLAKASDKEIMEKAAAVGALILTEDLDYSSLLSAIDSFPPGAIILRLGNLNTNQINQRLKEVLNSVSEDQLRNAITMVERTRVRIRRLPIKV